MASHVPFLAICPQKPSSDIVDSPDTTQSATTNGVLTPSASTSAPSSPPTRHSRIMPGQSIGAVGAKVPNYLRLPIALITSLTLNTLLYSFVSPWAGPEFASVKRPLTETWQIGALIAWRVAEMVGAWVAGYDYLDVACLTLMCNLPYYYLLKTFFSVSLFGCATSLAIDVCTVSIPFALLLPLDPVHHYQYTNAKKAPIDQDKNIRFLMTVLASSTYAVVIFSSIFTWLPSYMIVHFDGIRSLAEAHELALWQLGIYMVPLGMAATDYLFTPAAAHQQTVTVNADTIDKFNPETATLGQTLAYNLGFGPAGFSKKTEVLALRTAVLVTSQFANSVVRTYGTIEGTELFGALAWSGVWAVASGLVGLSYAWASNE